LPGASQLQSKLKLAKNIGGALAGFPKANPSVMAATKWKASSTLSLGQPQNLAKNGFALANKLLASPSAMARTKHFESK